MSNRVGEEDKVHFRAARFEHVNGQWYFLTREGTHHGPYGTREDAAQELKFYLRNIGARQHVPEDDYPGS